MHSFGNRSDCQAIDEPFYSYYLTETGLQHPMREAVIASQPTDWQQAMDQINGPVANNKNLFYVKHMTQHMLPDVALDQLLDHTHCFLIRDPRLVIASFSLKHDQVTAEATGFRRQLELYEYFKDRNLPVCVVEGEDIQKNPEIILKKLCQHCDIPFDKNMLNWATGKHPEDGVWGEHWYNAVGTSTGFAPFKEREVHLSDALEALATELYPFYLQLKQQKLTL